jgi:hypothetical protein
MSLKSSLPQPTKSDSMVLIPDSCPYRILHPLA